MRLVSQEGDSFDCKNCNGEVVAEGDKLAGQWGDGDDNAGGQQCEKLRTCFKNWRFTFCLFVVLVPFGLGYVFEFSMVHKLLFSSIE